MAGTLVAMSKAEKTPAQQKSGDNRSNGGDFSLKKAGILTLEDGTTWPGVMPDWQDSEWHGEVVFNTGMTGYVESLTDPSYSGQILVFTYPLIGNYGVNERDGESPRVRVRGVVVNEAISEWSHNDADKSLLEWLKEANVPVLSGVDTRALTKHLRTRGVMQGAIAEKKADHKNLEAEECFAETEETVVYNPNEKKTVVLVDCGAKDNIARSLARFPIRIKRVPHTYDFTAETYDGVFLSNGPGDPEMYKQAIASVKKVLAGSKPVFGICLGSQLIALAAGGTTYKLKFGHRGHNQPCQDADDEHCYITSQNHGYAVDAASLPPDWRVWFTNLNDGSVEGIKHAKKPFSAVQFHPEACPGPTDTQWLFERFIKQL